MSRNLGFLLGSEECFDQAGLASQEHQRGRRAEVGLREGLEATCWLEWVRTGKCGGWQLASCPTERVREPLWREAGGLAKGWLWTSGGEDCLKPRRKDKAAERVAQSPLC